MTPALPRGTEPGASRGPGTVTIDPWQGLGTLIRARLLVALLALPVGVLLRPDAREEGEWQLLWGALLTVAALSGFYAIGVRLRAGLRIQTYLQLAGDLLMVGLLAALTGGRESQFTLFLALAVITGGVLGGMPGGVFAAFGAGLVYLWLPAASDWLGLGRPQIPALGLPGPELILAFLAIVGVLAGYLGDRVQRTRHDLERTTRELDRVRVDNDVILRHLTSGVVTVDAAGRVGYLNPAAEQMLGLRHLELRGRQVREALPERLWALRELLADSLERRLARARVEVMLRTPAGRALPAGVSTNPLVHDGELNGVVAVFQDLTEVREMERRARRNQTLAELGALAAGIAHELRNGLNPISGSAECLQRELKLEGENAVLMELIVRECSRLNRFVTDLLNYARERELNVETLDVDGVLAELRDVLGRDPRCAPRTRVRCEEGPGRATVRADREMIRQVWLNLGANALESMPEGGELVLRWREGDQEMVWVEFEDTGSGIAAEDLPRVGTPFYTTKKGGTGLGLAIANRIVERHGGKLLLESRPGRGTRARVALPGAVSGAVQVA